MKIPPLVLVSFITPLSVWAADNSDLLPPSPSSQQRPFKWPLKDYHEEFREERERAERKGRQEGKYKVQIEIAQNIISALPTYTDKIISQVTELPEETVAALRRKIEAQKITAQEKKE